VRREFVDPVLVGASALGHGLSFGEIGATVVHPPSEHPGPRGEPGAAPHLDSTRVVLDQFHLPGKYLSGAT
jgi:hypothetical protein